MKIALVGEAWGAEEERARVPFVGPAGYCLNKMLQLAEINRHECLVTNVFNLRPKGNDIGDLCDGKKGDIIQGKPPIKAGKYIRSEYQPQLDRLYMELSSVRPHVIVALGGTAMWALCNTTGISKLRGAVTSSPHGKVLPTYHPAAVLRDWSLRPITIADLAKAKREAAYPEIRRPEREIWIEPSLSDIESFFWRYLQPASIIAIDIETLKDQITCIGFAPSAQIALVIPFTDFRKESCSYWSTPEMEKEAWQWVRRICGLPARKLFQNGLYDLHFLWRRYGITCSNVTDDTLLLHHALQPEMPKGLGFLGSIYTNEPAWKLMRTATIKRDE